MAKEPFVDILRRGLRWGGFAGLGVYLFAILTDNPSLYTSSSSKFNGDTQLESLKYAQLKRVYEAELRRSRNFVIDPTLMEATFCAVGAGEPIPDGYTAASEESYIINKTGELVTVCQKLGDSKMKELQAELVCIKGSLPAQQFRLSSEVEESKQIKILIEKLHEYNEVKDLAQALIGRLANIEGCTTKELYPRFDLSLQD